MAGNSAADSKPHSHLYPFQSFIFRFHFSALQLKKKMALWKPDFGIDKDRWPKPIYRDVLRIHCHYRIQLWAKVN